MNRVGRVEHLLSRSQNREVVSDQKLLLTEADIYTSVRDKGLKSLDDARIATVEPNGSIAVVPK